MNGVLVLNKHEGITSSGILNKIKRVLGIKKAGHTGTLDPFASGVLPICINEATKVIPYLEENVKEYTGTIELGITTDTLDITGKIIKKNEVGKIKESDILECFCNYKGNIKQLPPMYSAVKKDGVRLYSLARKGISVDRTPRDIRIEELELLDIELPLVRFYVKCSKGTYIRSLSNNIGEDLKCGGTLKELKRLSSGQFSINDSYSYENIENSDYEIIDLNELLHHLTSVEVNDRIESIIRDGKKLKKSIFSDSLLPLINSSEIFTFKNGNSLIGIAEANISTDDLESVDDDSVIFRILRVININ